MAIGRVSGSMLVSNLDRQGSDLQFTTNSNPLLYMDFAQLRLGVNTNVRTETVTINGNLSTTNILITDSNIGVKSGTLQINNPIHLGDVGNVKLSGGTPNYILSTDGAGNLTWANLTTLTGLEGFYGNSISLGSNTVGSYGNALIFTTDTKLTDAIASLNELLGNITDSTGTTIHTSTGTFTTVTVNGEDVYSNLSSTSSNVSVLQTSDAQQTSWLGNIDANVAAANVEISTLVSNAATQAGYITTLQSQVYSDANVAAYLPTYTGDITAANVTSTFYGNINTDLISPLNTTVTVFNSNTAIGLPVGNNSERPVGVEGYFRYNTQSGAPEYYNGVTWVPVTNTVTDQTITGDGSNITYTLDQVATNVGTLVSINGTLQQPGVAYSITGDQITFAEIPLTTDVIDVRFLGGIVSMSNQLVDDLTVSGNVTISGILQAPQTTKASNAIGTAGQICWDANYIYVCTATNTWKRSPLTGGY